MSSKTKKIFVSAATFALVSSGCTAVFYYVIAQEATRLEEQVQILNENNTKESAYVRMRRLVDDTAHERARLAASYFKNEGDSIAFLGEVEDLARETGLSFKTVALDKVSMKEKQAYVKMTFAYEGKKDLVLNFSRLFEVLPYHARVDSLSLRQFESGIWSGTATIFITIY